MKPANHLGDRVCEGQWDTAKQWGAFIPSSLYQLVQNIFTKNLCYIELPARHWGL